MKVQFKHVFVVALLCILAFAPAAMALSNNGHGLAQDFEEDLLMLILNEGAEIILGNVDDQGVPSVIYGQLGVPSDEMGFGQEMYTGCLAMAMISTQGEFLEMMFDLVGGGFFGGDNGMMGALGHHTPSQDPMDGFDPGTIFELLGTEFNLLISVFLDVPQATSQQRMSSILNHFAVNFQFGFAEVLILRIDESLFPPEAEMDMPFDSLDIYIYQITNSFEQAVSLMFGVMDDSGFLGAIDQSIFINARASAAGLLAIPDTEALFEAIQGFSGDEGGGDFFTSEESASPIRSFLTSQMPNVTGPLAVAAAGYLGEQVLSSSSTELGIAQLIGATTQLEPLDEGLSLVVLNLPPNANITSYSPVGVEQSMFDEDSNMVFWNATSFGPQTDYKVFFNAEGFPPLITISRSFSPATAPAGGSTEVTVTVTNAGDETINNVNITDVGLAAIYGTVEITGPTSTSTASLGPGETLTLTYEVSFINEGSYTFPGAVVTYTYDGNTYQKATPKDGFVVTPNIGSFLASAIADGWPYTGGVIGLVAVIGLWQIVGIFRRGKGGGEIYEV